MRMKDKRPPKNSETNKQGGGRKGGRSRVRREDGLESVARQDQQQGAVGGNNHK